MAKETTKVTKKSEGKGGASRKPRLTRRLSLDSPFLSFEQKTELPKVKAAQPAISHKEAFKVAAGNWKNAPENPANQKK
ncbi:hypothetical protein HK097_008917 [Rhizophlyctis rosea]|uniref:YABBY protein C-terminal domain-containing protein n=1 Tax=Rhizophlyctis rosea TaxID=64517 RepID=A0AAD5S9L8_9FUNG|nr:hypothetical protein HK097_008917 [Rhizophlyctis rosea]